MVYAYSADFKVWNKLELTQKVVIYHERNE